MGGMTYFARLISSLSHRFPRLHAPTGSAIALAPGGQFGLAPTAPTPPLPSSAAAHTSARISGHQQPVWLAGFWLSVWFALFGNAALWRSVSQLTDLRTGQQLALGLALAAALTAACTAVIALFAWGRLAKPLMVALAWIAAFAAYFMLNYGIAIDSVMLLNVLQTDSREAQDLLNWRMLVTVAGLAVPPTWWLWQLRLAGNTAWRPMLRQLGVVLAALLALVATVFIAFQPVSTAMRNHTQLRFMMNPLSSLYAVGNLAGKQLYHRDTRLHPIGEDAKLGASYAGQSQYPIYVLVVGETGRAGNFGLYGYNRPTTPALSARQDLAVASNAWSCGTSTAVSVPCMFSHQGRAGVDDGKTYENLLDILQRAGLAVLWVDNQSGCKGVCDRVHSASTLPSAAEKKAAAAANRTVQTLSPEQQAALCRDGECQDMALLEGLDDRINALPTDQRAHGVVLVLHQMGSHGPAYFKRSQPGDKKFTPECTDNALQSCDRAAVVNAYDNSIVATDRMLGQLIQWLEHKAERQPTAMVYVADHGESLGEKNIYLHGLPYSVAPDVQKHVPWITWLSPLMQQRLGIATNCLQKSLATNRISHDNYFHSVLGLTDVTTSQRKPQLDLFASCAGSAPVRAASAAPLAPSLASTPLAKKATAADRVTSAAAPLAPPAAPAKRQMASNP